MLGNNYTTLHFFGRSSDRLRHALLQSLFGDDADTTPATAPHTLYCQLRLKTKIQILPCSSENNDVQLPEKHPYHGDCHGQGQSL